MDDNITLHLTLEQAKVVLKSVDRYKTHRMRNGVHFGPMDDKYDELVKETYKIVKEAVCENLDD